MKTSESGQSRAKQNPSAGPRPERLQPAKNALFQSLFAESILLSIAGQMASLPGIHERPELRSVREEDMRRGHHRLTAQGCLERIGGEDWHETVVSQLVGSLYNARRHDRIQRGNLMELKRKIPADARTAVENWIQWLDYSENTLQEAMVHSRELIGSLQWNRFAPR
ncbi:hypothetical protein C8P63_10899 [Melghirimyces profundicolus]|uniref:Uncharacterized protein n=1 Tax=Melghirimyces profundicolus TaxID=1242148 RepID=A0A2T6BXI3_9BACL|nr:hypothetical protein [Melghirimyces profundicolus]PTX60789.1 hypothetical protein C8P63_10899 [Melghirimyces profundicolus]